MIFGFGFGSPLLSIAMLVVTSLISYLLYRLSSRGARHNASPTRAQLREYYYEQRRKAREFSRDFDLTDEEIEERIEQQVQRFRE